MKMYDCDVCMSAGSVNKWGCCEICGEEYEDPASRVMGQIVSLGQTGTTAARLLADMKPVSSGRELAAVGK